MLPHFGEFPLVSSKQTDVEKFSRVCQFMYQQRHLEREGLAEIVRIAMTMNPSGKRKYSERDILNSLFPDEGIVYAAGNRG